MMRFRTVAANSTAVLLLLSLVDLAVAQIPPHPPGSICFTPNFWCWANPPGPPGWACYCPSPQGLIRGTLG